MKKSYVQLILLIYLLTSSFNSVIAQAVTEENYVDMELEDLLELEIPEPDVFDVFNTFETRNISVASGVREEAAWAPAVTTVITAQDIEAIGARDLDEALERVPGLHVARTAFGYNSNYVIRGIYSSTNPEVLIMLNGVPIKSLEGGDRGLIWGGMPVQMIKRIEVIRGPGSAVYGADAFSGVVNIITKDADDIAGTELGSRYGSFDTYDAWWLQGNRWGRNKIAFGAQYQKTNGQHEIVEADLQTPFDQLFGTQASFAPGELNLGREGINAHLEIARDAGGWLRANYQGWDDVGLGLPIGSLDPLGNGKADRFNVDIGYDRLILSRYWEMNALLSFQHQDNSAFIYASPPGALGGLYPDGIIQQTRATEYQSHLQLSALYTGFARHDLNIGAGYRLGDMYDIEYASNFGVDAQGNPIPPGSPLVDLTDTPFATLPEEDRKSWFVFLQDTWRIRDDFGVSIGLRYDAYSDFDNSFNPRIALMWQVMRDLNAKLMYGQAFRIPSFRELYINNSGGLFGNPDLKAEQLENWEVALDWWVRDDLHLALNAYLYDVEDKIFAQAVPDQQNVFIYQNLADWRGRGYEFEMRWKMTNTSSLIFNYAQANVSQSSGARLGLYPRRQVYLRADFLLFPDYFSHWYLDVQYNWVGDRERQALDARTPLNNDTSVDFTLRYKNPRGGLGFAMGVKNLFDSDLKEPSETAGIVNDLPLAGQNYFIELRYQF